MDRPLPRTPSSESAGRRQLSSVIAQVSDPRDAELVLRAADQEAGRVGGHDERGNAFLAETGIGDREHDGHLGAFAIGDELLRTGQHPGVAVGDGARLEVVGLRAGLRFGEAEAADGPALGEVGQKAALLRVAAVAEYRSATDGVVHAHHRRSRGAARRNLLYGQCVGDIIAVRAAPFLRNHHAEETDFAELGNGRIVDPAEPVEAGRMGAQFLTCKFARRIANHALLVAVEIRRHRTPRPASRPYRVNYSAWTGTSLCPNHSKCVSEYATASSRTRHPAGDLGRTRCHRAGHGRHLLRDGGAGECTGPVTWMRRRC